MTTNSKLALIDAHSLIHRAYHALPPMSSRDGRPTNAVYGFTTMLFKMMTVIRPTHVVAAFDVKGPTFRSDLYKEYKAHRKPAPDDLISQFDLVRRVVSSFGIPIVSQQGFEADDVIGTLVKKVDGGVKKIVVTGDMDALQLIDEYTTIFTLKRGITDTVLYDKEAVKEKFGFGPEYVVDYKGLRGDPSDNIPGVAGVGDKTAKDLISTYGSIEEIYKHFDKLPKRAQTRLKDNKEQAMLSRELATINCDMDFDFDLESARFEGYDTDKVRQVFAELGFNSLLQRLPKGGTAVQPSLFQSSVDIATSRSLPDRYSIVKNKDDAQRLKKALFAADIIAFDTENDALGARIHPIVGMSFAVRQGDEIAAWYVPVNRDTVKEWQDILENPDLKKVGHNLKYDIEVLSFSGLRLEGIVFDSMLASYLLQPGVRQHSLDALAVQELNHHTIPITSLIGVGKEQKKLSKVPLIDLACYACEDAELTLRLYEKLAPKIEAEQLVAVLEELEVPLIQVLADMEMWGVRLDTKVLSDLDVKISKRLKSLKQLIWKIAGEEFNINSTQQLRVILFEKLSLPTTDIVRNQSGYSTAASELEKLHDKHEIISLLEEYRELTKLQNTYVETLPKLVDVKTGRIYTSFNQTVAATGRLSSSDPNLQNIPVRTSIGQEVRAAFSAEMGHKLVKADYAQIELRIAAHMSGDKKMLHAFLNKEDIHSATAAWVYGISLDKVTSKQRSHAKTLNFGVLYGMGPHRFARESGVSLPQARSFIGRYKEQYAGLTVFIEETIDLVREQGYATTLFGRKRYLPEINSSNPNIRAQAERMAFNFPIQGTEADIIKKAMIVLHGKIMSDWKDVKMVLTVHDELVCEVPEDKAEDFAILMKAVMEDSYRLDAMLVVDVEAGDNWKDMQHFKNI